jgi:hypothetical protein
VSKEPPAERPPARRRGGQELPDELQDRPEQNAGYDEAVRTPGGSALTPRDRRDVESLTEPSPEERAIHKE